MKKDTGLNELKDFESLDFDELLEKVEQSFNIKFANTIPIMTFGELCDYVTEQIKLTNQEDCTSQQAFYKLRESISSTFKIDKNLICPQLLLTDFLPRKNRIASIKKLENNLGFQLNIIGPPQWLVGILAISLLLSLVGLIFNWQIGLTGIALTLVGFWIAIKIGKELEIKTVGQAAEKMTRENYLKSRRDSGTINKLEIERILRDLFCFELDLDRSKLTRDTKFA